jgi:hypothetical protein
VRARRWKADGTFDAIVDLSAPGGYPQDPRVAVDASGAAHFTWSLNAGGRTRTWRPGEPLGPVEDLDGAQSDTARHVRVAPDPTGGVQYVWLGAGAGPDPSSRSGARGADGSLGTVQALGPFFDASGGATAGPDPALAVDAGAAAHVTWRTATASTLKEYMVHARTRRADGTLDALQPLGESPDGLVPTASVVVAGGVAHAGWIEDGVVRGRSPSRPRAGPAPVDDTRHERVRRRGPGGRGRGRRRRHRGASADDHRRASPRRTGWRRGSVA